MIKNPCHIILSRTRNEYAELLAAKLPNSRIIYDDLTEDKLMSQQGFRNMTKSIKSPCSWEKSFYFLSENEIEIEKFDHFFFIEDDVFSKKTETFMRFEERISELEIDILTHYAGRKEDSEEWPWWRSTDKNYFQEPMKSFNPYCILSNRLVRAILDFRSKTRSFMFHEIMFCSLAKSLGHNIVSLESLPFYGDYFGKFEWRPIIQESEISDERIHHPVKPKY